MTNCSKASIFLSINLAISMIIVGLREEINLWLVQSKFDIMTNLLCNSMLWKSAILIGLMILVVLFIVSITLLCRYNKHLKEANDKISAFNPNNSNSKLELEVYGVKPFIEIIASIAIMFCLGVAIHYLAVELPRIVKPDDENLQINSHDIDYLGLIVSIFAVIVTLLVTWQIYSTIKAKEELYKTKKDIEKRYNASFKKYKERLDENIIKLDKNVKDLENSLKHYIGSLSDYSSASLHRQTFLVLERSIFNKLSTPLFNNCFIDINNALGHINQTSIKDSISQIGHELLTLTNNVIERKHSKGIIKYIDGKIINNILLKLDEISIKTLPSKNQIILNLEEIKKIIEPYKSNHEPRVNAEELTTKELKDFTTS